MAYTLSSLQTEIYSRGFQYLNDSGAGTTRVTRWINDAIHLIDEADDWPYRLATATGTGSVTISDLGTVLSVIDSSQPAELDAIERDDLTDTNADVTRTGLPSVFYVQDAAPQVQVFPASSSAPLTVRYLKITPDLASTGDAPLMPDRFRPAIVEYAVAAALRDRSNYQEATAASQQGDVLVARMHDFYEGRAPTRQQAIIAGSEDS